MFTSVWHEITMSGDWRNVATTLLAVLFGAKVAANAYARVVVSDAERKAPRVQRPKGSLPFLHETLQAMAHSADFHDYWTTLSEDAEGRSVHVKILGHPDTISVATPELFEDILKTQFESFEKGPYFKSIVSDLLGDGIFAADGQVWVHQRKTASNLFSLRMLRESMAESVQKHITALYRVLFRQGVAEKQPVDLAELFNRFAIETFAEIGFGVDLKCLDTPEEHPFAQAFARVQEILIVRFLRPPSFWKLQRWLNVGMERELTQNIRIIHDMVLDIIEKFLENRSLPGYKFDETKKDIISLFLNHTSLDGSRSAPGDEDSVDPRFLRDIVVNFLIAGRDTTAQALVWLMYNVMRHPEVGSKIRQELEEQLPELVRGKIESPSMEQVQKLVYLEAAVRESLRLHPPVPGNMKQATKDIVLCDGTFVKKGWRVSISPYTLARMESVWGPDAKEYKPERWIDPETGKIKSVSAYKFPTFNAGPRICLGMNLALMEIKIVAASLLSKFHLELVPDQDIKYDFSLTLPIKGRLLAILTPAAAAM
uniref:Cytochrome P450 n=1 Tax=Globisporangium ultimum (strain ATCC 200006 / CBS 805.95 / DAOM BR144) TaxID=431595 RepID=K3WMJ0_GLOUD